MILPIVAYGTPVLRKIAVEIAKDHPQLQAIISDMFETMYASSGVGIAAPQVGKSIRIFVIDTSPFVNGDRDEDDEEFTPEEREQLQHLKKVFINAKMVLEHGDEWIFNEGCLSIPKIREDVSRKPKIHIQYYDEHFNFFDEKYEGIAARVIQHEYDHIDGILFVDHISAIRKRLIKAKLNGMIKGKVSCHYKVRTA